VEPATGPAQEASFEVVDENLAEAGLLHDARLQVMTALAKDPDEPSLHTLLGQLYQKSGLPDQAAESFDEAQFLLTEGAN
jgi:Tfp pilus assembly protein PilF